MWKTIVLCASLFGSAALGLVTAARWLEPAALPAAAAIGVCLIGVVLILLSPTAQPEARDTLVQPLPLHLASSNPHLEAMDEAPVATMAAAATTGPHATLH
jgi:hypothetical protein